MLKLSRQPSLIAIAVTSIGLYGCGTDETLNDLGLEASAPLVCQSPETINAAGTACELVIQQCNFPEVVSDNGTCVDFLGAWPDGANDITMPEPVYMAQAKADGSGYTEVVYYYNQPSGDFDGWGLHAWNNSDCASYSQFDLLEGGTDWGIPIAPSGEDPNFGVYFQLDLIDNPNCTNMIPYNFDAGIQTDDLSVNLSSADTNPTGNFYILARNEGETRVSVGNIYPHPRTFESLVVPGGSTPPPLECEAPEVLSEDGTECLPPLIEEFIPGEVTLYLRGGFNDWGNDADGNFALDDTVAFHYEENIYTVTMTLPVPAEGDAYEFKIADEAWSEAATFGSEGVAVDERTVVLDTPKLLLTGKDANGNDIESNLRIVVAEETSYQFTLNATDPAAVTLTVTEVPLPNTLYVRGSMNDWGNGEDGNFSLASGVSVMRYQGENIYTGRLTLDAAETAYAFKVADAGWTAETNFGALAGEEVVTLNESKSLTFGEESQNLQFTVDEQGTFLLTLDVTDPMAPNFVVRNAIPYGDTTVYIRGGMNDWGTTNPMDYLGEGIYQSAIPIAAGDYAFKVADADWGAETGVNFGFAEEGLFINLNEPATLVPGDDSQNMNVSIANDGTYIFSLDGNERLSPVLTVRNQEAFAGTDVFIRGSMNDWGTTDTMSYVGEGVYQANLALAAGDYAFKVASEDWATANYGDAEGGAGAVTLGEDFRTTAGETSANLNITIAEDGNYIFSIDVNDIVRPTLNVFSAAPSVDNTVYVRGSMNDWGTGNPMTASGTLGTQFCTDIALSAGDYAFKVASEDWASVNFGFLEENQSIAVDMPTALVSGETSQNMNVSLTEDATLGFDFTLVSPLKGSLTLATSGCP